MKILKIIRNTLLVAILFTVPLYISFTVNIKKDYSSLINLLTYKFDKKKEINLNLTGLYLNNVFDDQIFINNNENNIKEDITPVNNDLVLNTDGPSVYIYNTHSKEGYSYVKNDVYNIAPSVVTASYILEEELTKLGIKSIVEKESTTDIVNSKKLNFNDSYKVSRTLIENKVLEYASIKYFIDVHRDSVQRNVTTIDINGNSHARTMFVLGLENEHYKENKAVLEKLEKYLNTNYPGLSRGIYEKEGTGVNGVYNQDLDKNVMLIEIGGVDNTIEEVSNSTKIIAKALYNLIKS